MLAHPRNLSLALVTHRALARVAFDRCLLMMDILAEASAVLVQAAQAHELLASSSSSPASLAPPLPSSLSSSSSASSSLRGESPSPTASDMPSLSSSVSASSSASSSSAPTATSSGSPTATPHAPVPSKPTGTKSWRLGQVPVFHPTEAEFHEGFPEYVRKIEPHCRHAGLARIVPPASWNTGRQTRDWDAAFADIVIPTPIHQYVGGVRGVYQQTNVLSRPLKVPDFRRIADARDESVRHLSNNELERRFWKTVLYDPPIYGADMRGSLFDPAEKHWNVDNLGSILNCLDVEVTGVTSAYLYFGMWRAMFAWHTEDMDLYSVNYVHYGAPKHWYAIPVAHREKFERMAQDFFPDLASECDQFLRHKTTLISPAVLHQNDIAVYTTVQQAGEFVVTFPGVYHAGFNHGFNCAEAVNFATETWIEYGMRALVCNCVRDSVRINMSDFLHSYLRHALVVRPRALCKLKPLSPSPRAPAPAAAPAEGQSSLSNGTSPTSASSAAADDNDDHKHDSDEHNRDEHNRDEQQQHLPLSETCVVFCRRPVKLARPSERARDPSRMPIGGRYGSHFAAAAGGGMSRILTDPEDATPHVTRIVIKKAALPPKKSKSRQAGGASHHSHRVDANGSGVATPTTTIRIKPTAARMHVAARPKNNKIEEHGYNHDAYYGEEELDEILNESDSDGYDEDEYLAVSDTSDGYDDDDDSSSDEEYTISLRAPQSGATPTRTGSYSFAPSAGGASNGGSGNNIRLLVQASASAPPRKALPAARPIKKCEPRPPKPHAPPPPTQPSVSLAAVVDLSGDASPLSSSAFSNLMSQQQQQQHSSPKPASATATAKVKKAPTSKLQALRMQASRMANMYFPSSTSSSSPLMQPPAAVSSSPATKQSAGAGASASASRQAQVAQLYSPQSTSPTKRGTSTTGAIPISAVRSLLNSPQALRNAAGIGSRSSPTTPSSGGSGGNSGKRVTCPKCHHFTFALPHDCRDDQACTSYPTCPTANLRLHPEEAERRRARMEEMARKRPEESYRSSVLSSAPHAFRPTPSPYSHTAPTQAPTIPAPRTHGSMYAGLDLGAAFGSPHSGAFFPTPHLPPPGLRPPGLQPPGAALQPPGAMLKPPGSALPPPGVAHLHPPGAAAPLQPPGAALQPPGAAPLQPPGLQPPGLQPPGMEMLPRGAMPLPQPPRAHPGLGAPRPMPSMPLAPPGLQPPGLGPGVVGHSVLAPPGLAPPGAAAGAAPRPTMPLKRFVASSGTEDRVSMTPPGLAPPPSRPPQPSTDAASSGSLTSPTWSGSLTSPPPSPRATGGSTSPTWSGGSHTDAAAEYSKKRKAPELDSSNADGEDGNDNKRARLESTTTMTTMPFSTSPWLPSS